MSNVLIESFKVFSESLKNTYCKKTDVIDNTDELTKENADKLLSANIGISFKDEIDSLKGDTFTGVLSAGSTSITIATINDDISSKFMDIYTSKYGLNPSSVETDDTGNVTMSFSAQTEDINIKIVLR